MEFTEKRREPRFQIEANARIKISVGDRSATGHTVNVSGSGALVELSAPLELNVGDRLVCEFDVPADPDKPLSNWGTGRVLRVEGSRIAIALDSGAFAAASE